jgi:hypothetical protein
MPFTSIKQDRWGHTPEGEIALGGPAKVAEWDAATKGRKLPMYSKGSKPQDAAYAQGGSVLNKEQSEFLKTPDRFTGRKNGPLPGSKNDEDWKGGKPKGKDKSRKPILPRN